MNPEKASHTYSKLDLQNKWRTVLLLALAELLVMGLWFSASAVTPSLAGLWDLSGGQVAWLTMAVTVGFVVGAFLSALLTCIPRALSWRSVLSWVLGRRP